MKLYVGNLPFGATEQDVQDLFAEAGAVETVQIMRDQATGRPRGFGFVTMSSDEAGKAAIAKLDQQPFQGRTLTVNEAGRRCAARADSAAAAAAAASSAAGIAASRGGNLFSGVRSLAGRAEEAQMANRTKPTLEKRAKERARQEKRKQKEERRASLKQQRANAPRQAGDEDPDIAGITPGPQPSPWGDEE